MNCICRVALALGLGCLASQITFAQQLSISGTIQDSTGIVPDAQVTLRDPVGATTKTTSDAAGKYHFDGLRAGAYEIAVSHQGFAPTTRGLSLTGESRTVDLTLQVAGGSTSVDVIDVGGRATASGMEIPNREIPSYVVSIPERILREQGINELSKALENVSGVMTQKQYGVYEWYTVSGITQQSGNDFLYVDGMTLTGNRSASQLNNVEEVQVFKGPNSILYGGSGAGQGGMINIVRKKPSILRANEIQYQVGRWNSQQVGGSSTGRIFDFEPLMYRVDASYAHADGWRDAGANRFTIAPEFSWLISPRMILTTIQTFTRDRYSLDAGAPAVLLGRAGFPLDRRLNPSGDFQLTRDWQNEIDFSWNITNRLAIKNTFFKRRNRDQYMDAETLTYVPALDQVNRSILYYQHNRRPLQDITDVTGDYVFLGMRHRFLARYNYSDQYNYTNRTGDAPNTSNANLLTLPPIPVPAFIAGTFVDTAAVYTNFPITRRDFSDNRYHQVVLQDQVNPVRWIGINVVVSHPTFDRHAHNDSYNNGAFVSRGIETHIQNHSKNNYRVGAALIPQEHWNPWIRGFQPYFSYNSSFNPAMQIPADGSLLNPVLNKSWEVGTGWRGLNGKLSILTAARRIQDLNRVVTISTGVFQQVGKASTYSMDLDINGNLGRGLLLVGNYAYADSLIERFRVDGAPQINGGNRFPHAPKHISRIWLTKSMNVGESAKVNFSLGGRYQARYYANATNTNLVPSLTTFDGAVSLTRAKYDVQVNVANLLNAERYFVSQINGGNQLYPGPPFNATMTLRYRF